MLIRREAPTDIHAIRAVTVAAFARPDLQGQAPPEVALIEELRVCQAWLPPLSLVAVAADGDIVGHVLCTRGHVDSAPGLALGPLSVRPDHQRRGVGSALMHAVLGAAEALGEPFVALLGDPGYYRRFGFRPSAEYEITPPALEWRPHFQIRALTGYQSSLCGTFRYAEPFQRV